MLSLITCTGGRPEAFALLEKWIRAQTFRGECEWIVVDDVDPPTATTCKQVVIRPERRWAPGGPCTLTENLALALEHAAGDKILFIEDDEAYRPGYLESMAFGLEMYQLVGQKPARYYHVGARRYKVLANHGHASLCQTGIRRALRDALVDLCQKGNPFLDLELWRAHSKGAALIDGEDVVSIKGMPGRPGVGMGHRPQRAIANRRGYWQDDAELEVLKAWLGAEAAGEYSVYRWPND